MENLISLLIDLFTSLLGRSKKDEEEAPRPVTRPDPSRPRPPAARPTSWEDELRRLLEGQAGPASAPPAQRPPVMAPQAPQAPRVITVMAPKPPPARPAPVNLPQARPVPATKPSPIEVSARELAPLTQSQQAYARASQIDKTVAAHIEKVSGQHVQATVVIRRAPSPEVTQVISLFKNAKAARQAVMATVVFGPPRAFEEQTSTNF